MQAACRAFGFLKHLRQVAVRQGARQQVQVHKISRLDALFKMLPAPRKNLLLGFELGLDTKVVGGRSLGVEVAEEGPRPRLRRQIGKIDGGGRFSHPALHMIERQHLHCTHTPLASFPCGEPGAQ